MTLAIDEFGTGYSSFGYLRQVRVSKSKIDRRFIRDVAVNLDDAAIMAAGGHKPTSLLSPGSFRPRTAPSDLVYLCIPI